MPGTGILLPSHGIKKRVRQHPRYILKATGCSSTVYNVIGVDEKDTYARLLASRDLLDEHPRQDEFLDAIRQQKPFWNRGEPFYDWTQPESGSSIRANATDDRPEGDEGVMPVMEDQISEDESEDETEVDAVAESNPCVSKM